MARKETKTSSATKPIGSMKAVGHGQSAAQKNGGSMKTLYKPDNAKKQASANGSYNGRSAGKRNYNSTTGKHERGSQVGKSSRYSDEAEKKEKDWGGGSYSSSGNSDREKAPVNSIKSFYRREWEDKPEEDSFESHWYEEEDKDDEDKVDVGTLIYGIGEQGANQFFSGVSGTLDMFIGSPYQWALDKAEEALGIPDMGVNFLTAWNEQMRESSAAEAEYFAENASKGETASKLNQYGPDIVALLPDILLAIGSMGTSVPATGTKGLLTNTASIAGKSTKLDDAVDAAKAAGKFIGDNPSVLNSTVQTTGRSYNQALGEGADRNQARNYALTNGMIDLALNSMGLARGQAGIETLPGQLRNINDPMQYSAVYGGAAIHDGFENVIQEALQRASRAIYDEDVKLFSADDPNAVLNPNSALMDFIMGGVGSVAMGGIHAAKIGAETMASNQVSRMQSLRYMDELMKANEGIDAGYALQQAKILQKLTNGIVLEPEELRKLDMTSEPIQKFYTQKTGIAFSTMDNVRPDILRQKYQAGAIKARNGDIKVENTPQNILEKWLDERYNKGAKAADAENSAFKHGDWTKNVILEDGTHFGRNGRNKVLKPDTAYISGENHYIYQTDSLARPSNVTGVLLMGQEGSSEYRYKNPPEKIKGYDDSGHIVGRRFGAGGKLDNILSQCSEVNQREYKQMENVWAAALEEGKEVYVDFDIHYPGDSKRPDWYDVTYYIDGEYTSRRIFNPGKK